VFGEMTLCLDAPRQATVRSLDETMLLEVERGDLAPLLVANPALLEQLEQLVSQRQQHLSDLNDGAAAAQRRSLRTVMRQLFSGLGVR
jgi:CRP-like cAMP-binding protein